MHHSFSVTLLSGCWVYLVYFVVGLMFPVSLPIARAGRGGLGLLVFLRLCPCPWGYPDILLLRTVGFRVSCHGLPGGEREKYPSGRRSSGCAKVQSGVPLMCGKTYWFQFCAMLRQLPETSPCSLRGSMKRLMSHVVDNTRSGMVSSPWRTYCISDVCSGYRLEWLWDISEHRP